jgi:hypothetical protein
VDEELEKEAGKEELAKMKRSNPGAKSPLLKILSSIGNGKFEDGGSDQAAESLMLDAIGCTANVILMDQS